MTRAPLDHYAAIYRNLSPDAISLRCGLSFSRERAAFVFRIMGEERAAAFPEFRVSDGAGESSIDPYEEILILRYLCEGLRAPETGDAVAYRELPWGAVYDTNFRGRVIDRFARAFGRDTNAFRAAMARVPGARPCTDGHCDVGYGFEFMDGLPMRILLWEGDAEFSPSAQFLFDRNFAAAFSAEDVAVVGEIVIKRLNRLSRG
jgi:hypothetical protein